MIFRFRSFDLSQIQIETGLDCILRFCSLRKVSHNAIFADTVVSGGSKSIEARYNKLRKWSEFKIIDYLIPLPLIVVIILFHPSVLF